MKICFVITGKNLPEVLVHIVLLSRRIHTSVNSATLTLENQYGGRLDKVLIWSVSPTLFQTVPKC
jgi:hypothetical protein